MNRSTLLSKKMLAPTFSLLYKAFRYIFLLGISYIALFPIIRLVSVSLTQAEEFLAGTSEFIPQEPTFENYKFFSSYFDYFKHAGITLYVAGICTLLQCLICSLVGYGLGRYNFKGRAIVYGAMLFTIIMPLQTIQIPLYYDLRWFDFFGIGKIVGIFTGTPLTINLLNNYLNYFVPALFGVGLNSGIFMFLFQQYFAGMPKDLEDAAKLDGCNPFQIYVRVMIPNVTPVLATVTLLSMIYYWNDSFVAGMSSTSLNTAPIMYAIEQTLEQRIGFSGVEAATRQVSLYALMITSVLPLMAVFVVCQKFFVESMDRSGIKG